MTLLEFMATMKNSRILEKHTNYLVTLCSFWKNFSGHFALFVCNHSYCYAFRRIVQTDSLKFSQNSAFL